MLQPQGNDPRIGTWTLTTAESTIDPPNRLTITPVQDGSHVVMTGATHLDFTTSSGHPTPAPGNLGFNQIELKRAGKHQAEVKEEKNGMLVATVREALSPDGKELTSTTITKGQPNIITVWDRTGGARVAKDPFAGEWTQDLTKSRMRQGLVVKVEAAPNGYVHFTGDDTYTAAFDGKPHDVQHSRNDTVTLALTDPHTVDATYRRDNQVTERDHWVVSADGKQMTLTSRATLETGQHVVEKLTFRKR